jgi:hypothetical protein
MMKKYKCIICKDTTWVCEDHINVSWENGDECCGGAGAPCYCSSMHRDKIAYTDLLAESEKLRAQVKCNETYHRLGGIDDCEPCKALASFDVYKKGLEE